MGTQQVFNQAARDYRDYPLIDAKFIKEPTRTEVKQIFALLLSQERLKESMRDHLSDDYSESSPFLATMKERLLSVEDQLIKYEEKYGKLSEIKYLKQT